MNKIAAMAGICFLSFLTPTQVGGNDNGKDFTPQSNDKVQVMQPSSGETKIGFASLFEKPTIKIYPDRVINQGQTAFITVESKQPLNHPYYIYNNHKIPIYKDNDITYSGMIATNPNQKVGKTKIILGDDSKKLSDTLDLEIKRVNFGVQNVKLSKSVYNLKATEDENLKIEKALSTKSEIAFFEKPPYESPTSGPIGAKYGVRRYNNGKDTHEFHKGIDIKAPMGQPIKSIQPGKVLVAEQFNLNGGTVIVDHGRGMVSAYLHMSKIDVKPGQIVDKRQVLGKVGSTGHSSGPHLHWGLYINRTPVDPMQQWIKPFKHMQKHARILANNAAKKGIKTAVKSFK